jgi:hypothetical protein
MMWLIQHIVHLLEAVDLAVKTIPWTPTETGINVAFTMLCLVATVFEVCPRRVMAFNALLYLMLCMF